MASNDHCASIQVVQEHTAFHVWQHQNCFFQVVDMEGGQAVLILTGRRFISGT
jgi:hypothetical protein